MNLKLPIQTGRLVRGVEGTISVLIFALVLSVSQLGAAPAGRQLAWRDLVGHPERCPETTRLTGTLNFGADGSIKAGTALKIMDVLPRGVRLIAPQGFTFVAEPSDCDLLQAANAMWAKLTPEQQAFTWQQVQRDWSLLPVRVAINQDLKYGNLALPAGTEMLTLSAQGNQITMYYQSGNTGRALVANYTETDAFMRARELAGMPKEKRPDRMGEILSKVALDAGGKHAEVKSSRYYVIYVAASTCSRCEIFTPKLVEHVNKTLASRKDVAFITEPTDSSTPPMLAYMKRKEIPWPTVPVERKQVNHSFSEVFNMEIPGLVVVDKFGNTLLSSKRLPGGPLDSANAALARLDTVLKPVN